MRNRIILILVLAILMISLVSAEINPNSIPDNWIGRLISRVKFSIESGGYSVYGDTLGCDKTPTAIIKLKKGETKSINPSTYGAVNGFMNIFRGSPIDGIYPDHPADSRQYLGEWFIKSPFNYFCDAGAYWNNDCYVDFYKCPVPCYSDSDCSSGKICDKSVLSQAIDNAGVCIISQPTHKTKVYRCSNGQKTYINEVSYGNINFCSNPSDNKYLVGDTDRCLPLSQEPVECSQPIECSTGQEKCDGANYYLCENYKWVNKGVIQGKCGNILSCEGTCRFSCKPEEIDLGKISPCGGGIYILDSKCCKSSGSTSFFGNGLTVSEFLSAGYLDIAKSLCSSSCNPRDGYNVTCDKKFDDFIIKDISKESCSDLLSALKAVPIVGSIVINFVCSIASSPAELTTKLSPYGVCIAKPENIFSRYYNSLLKSIYELGVPRTWVVPILLVLLILITLIIINMLK